MHQKTTIDTCLAAAIPENNYYERMSLGSSVVRGEAIEARYDEIGKILHPDLDRTRADEIDFAWKLVKEAYDVLSDDVKRSEYNNKLEQGFFHSAKKALARTFPFLGMLQEAALPSIVFNSSDFTPIPASKDEALLQARSIFMNNDWELNADRYLQHVDLSVYTGVATANDFKTDTELQGLLNKMSEFIWKSYDWRVAPTFYSSYVHKILQTGTIDAVSLNKNAEPYILAHARAIWQNNTWDTAPDFYDRFIFALEEGGVTTRFTLNQDKMVQALVLSHARSIFKDSDWKDAPRNYQEYTSKCEAFGVVIEDSIVCECIVPLVLRKAIQLFDQYDWRTAPLHFDEFQKNCSSLGVPVTAHPRDDMYLNEKVSTVCERIRRLYDPIAAAEHMEEFKFLCRQVGINIE